LSGLVGVGGGFLIVPALVLLAAVPMSSAVGTSLAVIAMNSFTGFGKYLFVLDAKGVALDWRTLLTIALIGIVGSMAGNRVGRRMPQAKLRKLFGLFLVGMGLFVAADAVPRLIAYVRVEVEDAAVRLELVRLTRWDIQGLPAPGPACQPRR
jgi:uncharacterized membrane protein YfcA